MLTLKQLENGVVTSGLNVTVSKFVNVLNIALYGLQMGTKDASRTTLRQMLGKPPVKKGQKPDPDALGMAYSTAAAQVAIGMDLAAFIKHKFPEHALFTMLSDSATVKDAIATLEAFLLALNVRSGSDAKVWALTDGTRLSQEARIALTMAPAKAEVVAKVEPEVIPDVEATATAPVEPEDTVEPEAVVDPVETMLAAIATLGEDDLRAVLKAANDRLKALKAQAQPVAMAA